MNEGSKPKKPLWEGDELKHKHLPFAELCSPLIVFLKENSVHLLITATLQASQLTS